MAPNEEFGLEKPEEFYIHDNYSLPFRVVIDPATRTISAYSHRKSPPLVLPPMLQVDNNSDVPPADPYAPAEETPQVAVEDLYGLPQNERYEKTPCFTTTALRVFIGESLPSEATFDTCGPKYHGNTILVETAPLQYIFIGRDIRQLTTAAPVAEFGSPVINNDVPYPYAVDENGITYLICEDVVLPAQPFTKVPIWRSDKKYDHPHDYYYEQARITSGGGPATSPPFREILCFWIGQRKTFLTYSANFRSFKPKHPMWIKRVGEPVRSLPLKEYMEILTEFERLRQFEPLRMETVVAPPLW
jgi:hypothetical protein